jgi:hypothetical protein
VATTTKYSSVWAALGDDFDSDGFTDVWVANAAELSSYDELAAVGLSMQVAQRYQSDFLFHNIAGGSFDTVLVPQTAKARPYVTKGATATADYDGDGRLDILEAVGPASALELLHNIGAKGHYLNVRLHGAKSNRDGIGARITLRQSGRPDVSKLLERTRGSIGSSWPVVHFGLGARTDVDGLDVKWPSGVTQTISGPMPVDRMLELTEPSQ